MAGVLLAYEYSADPLYVVGGGGTLSEVIAAYLVSWDYYSRAAPHSRTLYKSSSSKISDITSFSGTLTIPADK